jgi:hypothetical protein
MSVRLLNGWIRHKFTLHTAIDDLESFAWSVLWASLKCVPVESLTLKESGWLVGLASDSVGAVSRAEESVAYFMNFDWEGNSDDAETLSPPLRKLSSLFRQ